MGNRVQAIIPGTQTVLKLSPVNVNHRAWGATDIFFGSVRAHDERGAPLSKDAEQAPVYYVSKTLLM